MTESEKNLHFQEIFKRNYQKLFLYALYLTGNEEDARDVVGDVFRRVLENYHGVLLSQVDSYLFTATKSHCIDLIRHRKRTHEFVKYYNGQNDLDEQTFESYDQRLDDILETIHAMPEKTRRVMELCYLEDMTYKEAGELVGLAPSGIKKHILKGLQTIRQKFNVNYKKGAAPKEPSEKY